MEKPEVTGFVPYVAENEKAKEMSWTELPTVNIQYLFEPERVNFKVVLVVMRGLGQLLPDSANGYEHS